MTIVGLVLLVGGALLLLGAFVTRAGHPVTQTMRLSAAGIVPHLAITSEQQVGKIGGRRRD